MLTALFVERTHEAQVKIFTCRWVGTVCACAVAPIDPRAIAVTTKEIGFREWPFGAFLFFFDVFHVLFVVTRSIVGGIIARTHMPAVCACAYLTTFVRVGVCGRLFLLPHSRLHGRQWVPDTTTDACGASRGVGECRLRGLRLALEPML